MHLYIFMGWYPQVERELKETLSSFIEEKNREVNGVIVPHAGYVYSGKIAGKAFSYLKSKDRRAIVLGPNHYYPVRGIFSYSKDFFQTPLGKIKSIKEDFSQLDFSQEHSILNQIPFLQFLKYEEVLALLVSQISLNEAEKIAEKLARIKGKFVFSTDLSHFLSYEEAKEKDEKTIKAIENLDGNYFLNRENSACGIYPLLILIKLCKKKKWKPKLIQYKNSGDVIGDKSSVVGYASFVF